MHLVTEEWQLFRYLYLVGYARNTCVHKLTEHICAHNTAGVGIHYLGVGLLENNTLVTADTDQILSDFHCSSGSTMPNTGSWIAPNGNDLSNSTVDPFNVIQGGEHDPGSLIIQQAPGHIITKSFQGVYTCILPDDNGVLNYIHIGIYRNGFNCELALILKVLNVC